MKPKESCYLANTSTSSAEAGREGKHGCWRSIGIPDVEQVDCNLVYEATNVGGGGIRRVLHDRGGGIQAGPSDSIGTNAKAARMHGSYYGEERTPSRLEAHGGPRDRPLPKVKSP
jgi:hypothetical protein